MEKAEAFCKVDLNGKIVYAKFVKRGITWEYSDFILALGIHADIPAFDIANITDKFGVVIPEEDFVKIFFERYTHPEFILKIKRNDEISASTSTSVYRQNCRIGHDMYFTSEELENSLLKTPYSYVLLKKHKSDKSEIPDLSDIERRAIIRVAVNLMVEKYTYHPEHDHKLALAYAIVKLFPQLKTNDSSNEGVDLLYNRNQNRGYIITKLNNIRNKLYKIEAEETNTPISKKRLSAVDKQKFKKSKIQSEASSIPIAIEEDYLILKNLNVATQKGYIKEKLRSTLTYREDALKKNCFKKISQAFPFFFTSPDLILFDFDLRYPQSSNNFINDWPNVSELIEKVWRGFKGSSVVPLLDIEDWVPSYQKFFYLLSLLPQTALGKTSAQTKRLPFRDSISRIIHFKPLNLTNEEFLQTTNISAPYLIGSGENTKAITNFMLCIENELIPLPANFCLMDAIDILFKAHYVFNQHFDVSVKNFWLFMRYPPK